MEFDHVAGEKLDDVCNMLSIDQSYTIDFPILIQVHTASTSSGSDSSFTDALTYTDCGRGFLANSQTALEGPAGELDDIDS